MQKMALVAIVLIGVVLPQYALAACGYEGVSVSGTAEEVADACRAIDEVLSYFKKIGFQPDPEISISFQDRVYVDMYLHTYGPGSKEPVGKNEVSGFYDSGLLGNEYQKLGKTWHEFVAYAVQFDLMDRELKSEVLANYPDAQPFGFPESVNAIVYAADPDEFGVSAYLYTEANGGSKFVGQILAKQVPFSTGEFEFFWVK